MVNEPSLGQLVAMCHREAKRGELGSPFRCAQKWHQDSIQRLILRRLKADATFVCVRQKPNEVRGKEK